MYTSEMLGISPTIFPDGTSQVWKLPLERFNRDACKIIWHFESEAELMHLYQVMELLDAHNIVNPEIFIPFLPYARQDKEISNENTFALKPFLSLLNYIRCGRIISTLDIHSEQKGILSYPATNYIRRAIKESQSNVLVFPDAGAAARYEVPCMPYVILDKERNQETGAITGIKFSKETEDVEIDGKRLLIVDDICDGGATFLGAARLLYQYEIDYLSLYVTHGIFSKGFDHLIDGGIREFYTTRSLRKNINGFELF
jgi:ribose-phosphate pyrophosphokinase